VKRKSQRAREQRRLSTIFAFGDLRPPAPKLYRGPAAACLPAGGWRLCGCAAVWWPGPACTLRVGALRHEEEEREHRDNIVDGSDDSDEVVEVEVSMEDMLNNDHAVSLSTTNDAARSQFNSFP
jgi:hypothetical protein